MEIEIIDKPWGREIIWAHSKKYIGKILEMRAGTKTSLQFHKKKDETIMVLAGVVDIETHKAITLPSNERPQKGITYHVSSIHQENNPYFPIWIPPKLIHRIVARTDAKILEVSTPEIQDVVRIEDDYGREVQEK